MNVRYVVAGTDTGVGKTVFCAALVAALDGAYWKPVQAGVDGETDTEIVYRLSGAPASRILPEAYRLTTACSPHRAAEIDGIVIDPKRLTPPLLDEPLVIETAGGLMVPLNRGTLQIDVLARWEIPIILCARTTLGTINHSLLSIEALRSRKIPLHGIAFIGSENTATETTIVTMGNSRRLGRLPNLDRLDRDSLRATFASNFRREDFSIAYAASVP